MTKKIKKLINRMDQRLKERRTIELIEHIVDAVEIIIVCIIFTIWYSIAT